jgi:hypothetical protein
MVDEIQKWKYKGWDGAPGRWRHVDFVQSELELEPVHLT